MDEDAQIDALADEHHADRTALRELLSELRDRAGAEAFYIFWSERGSEGQSGGGRPRTLVAFASPDAALAFAQRNRMAEPGHPPRLRRLTLTQLMRVLLREPSVNALLLAAAEEEPPPPGRLPAGVLLAREAAIARLGAG